MDFEHCCAKVSALPVREDIDLPIEENRIVELYSK
jgi:ribosomal protein S4